MTNLSMIKRWVFLAACVGICFEVATPSAAALEYLDYYSRGSMSTVSENFSTYSYGNLSETGGVLYDYRNIASSNDFVVSDSNYTISAIPGRVTASAHSRVSGSRQGSARSESSLTLYSGRLKFVVDESYTGEVPSFVTGSAEFSIARPVMSYSSGFKDGRNTTNNYWYIGFANSATTGSWQHSTHTLVSGEIEYDSLGQDPFGLHVIPFSVSIGSQVTMSMQADVVSRSFLSRQYLQTYEDFGVQSLDSSISITWSGLNLPTGPNGERIFKLVPIDGPDIDLSFHNPIPGDMDYDFELSGRDFLSWQRGESPSPYSSGDLELWQANYGCGLLDGSIGVPEPSTMILALSLALMSTCKWRHSS